MLHLLIRLLSRISLRTLYGVSDYVLYPIIYHVVRYRRRLVANNLQQAFPHYSSDQRLQIERDFYHHFADVIVEIIWAYRATREEMNEHVRFHNVDLVEQYAHSNHGVIVMLGHLGNWEWGADLQNRLSDTDIKIYNVYRQLKNTDADSTMKELRERIGGKHSCVEKNQIIRHLLTLSKADKPFIIGLISDQKVSPKNAYSWTTFLHLETSFLGGGEVLSTKFNLGVVYARYSCPKRGHYDITFIPITHTPQLLPKENITREYARLLESNIIAQPHLWLWTHNRWKWKRSDSPT